MLSRQTKYSIAELHGTRSRAPREADFWYDLVVKGTLSIECYVSGAEVVHKHPTTWDTPMLYWPTYAFMQRAETDRPYYDLPMRKHVRLRKYGKKIPD